MCSIALKVYKNILVSEDSEKLECSLEMGNIHNPFAIAVLKNKRVVDHVSNKVSSTCSLFIKLKGTIQYKVTGLRHYSISLPQDSL